MDDVVNQIVAEWHQLDMNVETPMAFDHVINVADQTIQALIRLLQEKNQMIVTLTQKS